MFSARNVRHEHIQIDIDSLKTSTGHLIYLIKPTWISKKLIFKKLGMNYNNNFYYEIFPSSHEDEQHGIVIRLYPTHSDVYTDHQKELRLIEQLIHHRIASHILLTFMNGYFSTFILGKTLDIKNEHVREILSRKLAEFHSISFESHDNLKFIDRLKQFINLFTKKDMGLENRLNDINQKLTVENGTFLSTLKSFMDFSSNPTFALTLNQLELQLKDTSWTQLSSEIDFIQSIFEKNSSKYNLPIVLCLNKLNVENFLYDSKNNTISILDFDHCSYNYFLVDIVSYFLELAKDDYETKYPSRDVQKIFLIEYLKHSSLNLSHIIYDRLKPIDNELERLCDLCGLLIAPIHLYWALWSFLQALLTKPISTFDYINYGKIRLEQYQKHKENFFRPLYHSKKNLQK